jgi:hypothetical protein
MGPMIDASETPLEFFKQLGQEALRSNRLWAVCVCVCGGKEKLNELGITTG